MRIEQDKVRAFRVAREWAFATPSAYAKSISIEAAELLEIFQWSDHSCNDIMTNMRLRNRVMDELADVFIYGLDLANILEIDAATIVSRKLRANRRKYPVSKVRGNQKRYENLRRSRRKAKR